MPYKFGVSFNCVVYGADGRAVNELGGADDGSATVDYVGNDLKKIEAALCRDGEFEVLTDHQYVDNGHDVNVGGMIVAVLVNDDGDVSAVVFTDPPTPTVIE